MTTVDDQKIIDIETQLAHQEQLLSALNVALSNQQAQIADLEQLCRSLVQRIRTLSEARPGNGNDEDQPPHY